MKQPLIVVLGPTASGKTALALELCSRLSSEIISGDSMLVYRGFDIGAAKPTLAERQGIAHHLVDICDWHEDYSVARFQSEATQAIGTIAAHGKVPLLCGGTGLYAKALLEGYEFSENGVVSVVRMRLNKLYVQQGIEALTHELLLLDSCAHDTIDMNNPRRIMRAIELLSSVGTLPSRACNNNGELTYKAVVLAIDYPRSALYERINRRVDFMMKCGLVDEVEGLLKSGVHAQCQPMRGIGYKEIVPYIAGECSLEQATENIKTNTRHFAKRQLTWYKKMPYIRWIPCDELCNKEFIDILLRGISRDICSEE